MADQALQNMQQQIQVWLQQVTLLSQTTDTQQQKLEAMNDYNLMKDEVIRLRGVGEQRTTTTTTTTTNTW